jgi:4-carboxymuconolactone decarboxylase
MSDDTVRPAGLSAAQKAIGDVAPKLAQLTEDVLFDDVWERGELGKRDRSFVTVAALIALGRTEQLAFHLERAIENGITPAELVEVVTHLAFYSGWPTAMSATGELRKVLRHGP